jgi:flagellar hook-length control protein FliK
MELPATTPPSTVSPAAPPGATAGTQPEHPPAGFAVLLAAGMNNAHASAPASSRPGTYLPDGRPTGVHKPSERDTATDAPPGVPGMPLFAALASHPQTDAARPAPRPDASTPTPQAARPDAARATTPVAQMPQQQAADGETGRGGTPALPALTAAPESTADPSAGAVDPHRLRGFAEALAPLKDSAEALQAIASPASVQPTLQPTPDAAGFGASAVTASIDTPFGATDWDAQLGQQLLWMADGKHQVAELRINPPDLGPVHIVLTLGGDSGHSANVQFVSPHAPVREAIEAAMPRLRDMLAEAGISLGQATVGADSFRGGGERDPSGERTARGRPMAMDDGTGVLALPAGASGIRGIGLVDVFA